MMDETKFPKRERIAAVPPPRVFPTTPRLVVFAKTGDRHRLDDGTDSSLTRKRTVPDDDATAGPAFAEHVRPRSSRSLRQALRAPTLIVYIISLSHERRRPEELA